MLSAYPESYFLNVLVRGYGVSGFRGSKHGEGKEKGDGLDGLED